MKNNKKRIFINNFEYPFFDNLQKLVNNYYQIYDNKTLEEIFNEVIINENDYLKEKRHSVLKKETWLNSDNAENILNDIRK